ncbi:MAG TPA: alpha-hydroxy acid oxidase [Chloroflexota bacterium]|nr:alpha-hydroxy acid oxidase [Chloroflexota bacterium]
MEEYVTLGQMEAAYERALKALDPVQWAYVSGGSEAEISLRRNRAALEKLAIEQHVLRDISNIDLSTTFLGMKLPMPITVCPMGGLPAMWPNGNVEMARGATAEGGLATMNSGGPLKEQIDAANGPLMFQLYNTGDKDFIARKVDEVQGLPYKAIVLTVDTAVPSRRDFHMEAQWAKLRGQPVPEGANLGTDHSWAAMMNWDYVKWLRSQVKVAFGLKGIMTPADAKMALECGVDIIWVSNHGGRQLDSGRATIDALEKVANAVGGRAEIVVDGGFRRGTDIIKGLCMGANIVAMGRTFAWGLSSGGPDGVKKIAQLLRRELLVDMSLCGQTSVKGLKRELIDWVSY